MYRKYRKLHSSYFSDGGGAAPGGSSSGTPGVTTPTIFNDSIAAANTEYSYALPAGTRHVEISNHGTDDLKLSYVAGQSSSTYRTVPCGSTLSLPTLDSTASIVLYYQSPAVGGRIEIETWA